MATGIFKLRDQLQGLITKAWYGNGQLLNSWSSYAGSFNGSSQYLTLASNTAFNVFGGNMTIECWFYANSIGASPHLFAFVETSTNRESIYFNGQALTFYSGNGSGSGNNIATPALSAGVWYHMALVKSGSTFTLFLNGVAVGTSTTTYYSTANQQLQIGTYNSAGYAPDCFNGYISNVRVVKGTAVYTNSFVPPVLNLTNITNTSLLTLQNATIIDNSSNAFSITNSGSVATSTQTINLQITQSPNAYATPAVEYLVVAGGGGGGPLCGGGGGGGGLLQGISNITVGTPITVTVGSSGAGTPSGSGNATTVGGNGTNSVFANITATGGGGGGSYNLSNSPGSSGGSGGGGGNYSVTAGNLVGGNNLFNQGNGGGTGYLPATNGGGGGGGGAGTIGLNGSNANGANGGAGIGSSINGTVTTYSGGGGGGILQGSTGGTGGIGGGGAGSSGSGIGTAGSSNTGGGGGGGAFAGASYYGGGNGGSGICIISYPDTYNAPTSITGTYTASTSGSGSISFNGSTQYLKVADNAVLNMGSSNFTIEGWYYALANVSASSGIFSKRANGSVVGGILFYMSTTGLTPRLLADISGGWGVDVTASSGFTLNQWNHFAVVRNSNTWTIYINGISVGTTTNSGTVTTNTAAFGIAIADASADFTPVNAYISNFRIVKGTAVYTANFTPSTIPLTAITNTSLLLNTISGAQFVDTSSNSLTITATGIPTWNQSSPFATGLGYKNRVYTWTASGTVTF
jgi:hypothetical protein